MHGQPQINISTNSRAAFSVGNRVDNPLPKVGGSLPMVAYKKKPGMPLLQHC